MTVDDETAQEELELYGDALPDDDEPAGADTKVENVVKEESAVQETTPTIEAPSVSVKSKASPVTDSLPASDSGAVQEDGEPVVGKGGSHRGSVAEPIVEKGMEAAVEESGATAKDAKSNEVTEGKTDSEAEKGAAEAVKNGDTKQNGTGKGGSGDSDDSEDTDDDDEEEDDDDDDQDDFDVILNCEDGDTSAKPGGPSFGSSIGKVRLPPNKWQRDGYTPPERVIGNVTQTGARTGGVLSMLPTPTMQIGVSQKSVYDLEIGRLTERPWLERGADLSDYFNYGFSEDTWKLYCERQMQMRLEASSLAKIKTVDGNKNASVSGNRTTAQASQKNLQNQPNAKAGGSVPLRAGPQGKMSAPPPPPPGSGMMPPPGIPPGPMPGMPGMPKIPPNMPKIPPNMPNMPPNMPPFPFPPPTGKGGTFQPPFQPFPPIPNNQGKDGGKNNMFPFLPGMPGMPGMPPGMPMPPGPMPPGMNRAGTQSRGFPGQMHTPQKLQQQTTKGGRGSTPPQRPSASDNPQARGSKRPLSGDQPSRFGAGPGGSGKGQHQARHGQHQVHHQGGHQDDDRRRYGRDNDRRQGYDRQGGDRGGHVGDSGGRTGYDEQRYNDRGHDRRRSGWGENRNEGVDRRRGGGGGGGYEQRYSDRGRNYDRDRDRDYRKRAGAGRDYEEDRKRSRR